MITVGCAGFAVPATRYFKEYFFVEVQETHLAVPGPGSLRRWRREAPNGFEFALLGPREVGQEGFREGKVIETALKAIEGAARFVTDLLRNAFTSSFRSKVGFLVSRPATELLKHHLDPNNHNGAVFLGLNGVIVKSHGSANAAGVANAVAVAARLLEESLTERIAADLAELGEGMLRENGAVGAAS